MINVQFEEITASDGTTFYLKVTGHANYAEHGKDIVCAGVSAITQALESFVENETLECDISESPDGGYSSVYAINGDERIRAAFDMAFIGMIQIEMAHPSFVTVTKKNREFFG